MMKKILILVGFLAFLDPPKHSVKQAVTTLQKDGANKALEMVIFLLAIIYGLPSSLSVIAPPHNWSSFGILNVLIAGSKEA